MVIIQSSRLIGNAGHTYSMISGFCEMEAKEEPVNAICRLMEDSSDVTSVLCDSSVLMIGDDREFKEENKS